MAHENPRPLLMVDVVLLTLLEEALHVGLVRRTQESEPYFGAWGLPGGFIRAEQDLDAMDTARRVLATKAAVKSPYLEQLATFTGASRDPRGWSASIAYYALVPSHVAPDNNAHFAWTRVDEALSRTLPFDHTTILRAAVERVRSKTSYSALPVHLMPDTFTMSELRAVYEQLLGGRLEPRGFIRRIDELDILEETGDTKTEGHRPARVYRVRSGKEAVQLEPSLAPRPKR
ncbi:NUDIX hydrolase [Bordetella genomosp. 5]|uniref:Uncharacterized protein n=1 Tax=Bordetella genomosp. 5 TaxID=1395608 RepID=A0A261TWG3_9BORD|nr:NUDIX domain-containing protein [Bordetella genomosp. 5]OZI53607.1 hypothetical protein CAL25_06435 [Bordetella genomosp. 5]